jgi:sugar phosphate isomerase/epimerase
MKPCISQATTLNTPFEDDLDAYARGGWRAVELWLTKLETFLQGHTVDEARKLLAANGLTPAAAAGQGGLLLSRGAERVAHWEHFRRRLEVLQQLGVPVLVVAADFVHEPAAEDYARASDALAEAGAEAARCGVRVALEFQKSARFCASLDTTLALIAQCGADNVGVCLDVFHYYTGPSKFEDLAYLNRQNLAWVQLCDLAGTPREVAGDADRILPGEGDFQIGPILDHLGRIGYTGCVSLEVLNPHLWQVPVDRVADAGFQALCRTLGSWNEPDPGPDQAAEPTGGP